MRVRELWMIQRRCEPFWPMDATHAHAMTSYMGMLARSCHLRPTGKSRLSQGLCRRPHRVRAGFRARRPVVLAGGCIFMYICHVHTLQRAGPSMHADRTAGPLGPYKSNGRGANTLCHTTIKTCMTGRGARARKRFPKCGGRGGSCAHAHWGVLWLHQTPHTHTTRLLLLLLLQPCPGSSPAPRCAPTGASSRVQSRPVACHVGCGHRFPVRDVRARGGGSRLHCIAI